jgi:hypothetical protein
VAPRDGFFNPNWRETMDHTKTSDKPESAPWGLQTQARREARRAERAQLKADAQRPLTIDEIIRKHTMWKSLDEAVTELARPDNSYRPSIYTANGRHKEKTLMANAIDTRLKALGSPKTVWRGW